MCYTPIQSQEAREANVRVNGQSSNRATKIEVPPSFSVLLLNDELTNDDSINLT